MRERPCCIPLRRCSKANAHPRRLPPPDAAHRPSPEARSSGLIKQAQPAAIEQFIANATHFLVAISLGAVFFGAVTSIGNRPNFMVKNISQQPGMRTPSFFTYLFRYALPILIPIYVLIAILFFSRWRIF